MTKKILCFCILLALITSLAACGDKKTEIKTDEGTVTVTESGDDTVTVESENGNYQAGSNASKPADWPDGDFPIIDGGKILGSMSDAGGDGGLMVVFGINKTVDEAQAFYKDIVAGASDAADMSISGTKTMAGTKAGFTYGITISTEDTGYDTNTQYPTYVTIILSPETN